MPITSESILMHENPIIDFMLKRRSVLAGSMIEPAPSDADLNTILSIATRVPDHAKLTPWHIQVLHKPGQQALADVYRDAFVKANPEANDVLVKSAHERLTRSPLVLVVSCQPRAEKFEKIPHIEQQLSAGAVCSHILIAAGALNYAAQWLTGGPAYEPAVKQALGMSEDCDIVGFIHLGSKADEPRERPRPELETVVSEWDGSAL
ncbi:MAG: nitroreductase [Pseudomonadota bacterium]